MEGMSPLKLRYKKVLSLCSGMFLKQNAPEADRRNVPDDVISVSDSEVDQASSHDEVSSYESGSNTSSGENSSESEPAMSEVSDQYSMLEHAYQSVRDAFSTTRDGKLIGGDSSLNQLEALPAHWPLAKLTLPLKFGVSVRWTGGRVSHGTDGHTF